MVRNRKGEAAPGVELPVTPMLDMTFQLLAFFILTYHPSAVEGQMEFSLPSAASSPQPLVETPLPPAGIDPLDEKSQLTVVLKAQHDGVHDGVLSTVLVQSSSGVEVALPGLAELSRYLQERRVAGDTRDAIQLQAESQLKYAWVTGAMDACLKAGFKQVGFASPPDLGRDR